MDPALRTYSALRDAPRDILENAFLSAVRGGLPPPSPSAVRRLSQDELALTTHRLSRRQHECGCTAGAWTLLIAVVTAVVVDILYGASSGAGALVLVAVSIAFVLVATAVG